MTAPARESRRYCPTCDFSSPRKNARKNFHRHLATSVRCRQALIEQCGAGQARVWSIRDVEANAKMLSGRANCDCGAASCGMVVEIAE